LSPREPIINEKEEEDEEEEEEGEEEVVDLLGLFDLIGGGGRSEERLDLCFLIFLLLLIHRQIFVYPKRKGKE